MSLLSLSYLLFLFCAVAVYYCLPQRLRRYWLLAVSLAFFVLSCGWTMGLYLVAGIAVTYSGARLIDRTEKEAGRKALLAVTLAVLLGGLFLLKDINFFPDTLNAVFSLSGKALRLSRFELLAPIGVSYYTLSAAGYVLDVYWRSYSAERNPLHTALFMCYFPQMTSGPVTRYGMMKAELFEPHPFDYTGVKYGLQRIVFGYFKKILIADQLIVFSNAVLLNADEHGGAMTACAVICYAFYLYADFSGCMDIVTGSSELFGIRLPENFRRPFLSLSLGEFWRRWHISLGLWFKDYLLYPLLKSNAFQRIGRWGRSVFGKKSGKKLPTYLGLCILWLLIGLWHGGSWKYIFASGILPGFFLISGEVLEPIWTWLKRVLRVNTDCFSYRLFCRVRTFCLMCIVFFFVSLSTGPIGGIRTLLHAVTDFSPSALSGAAFLELGLGKREILTAATGLAGILVCSALSERGTDLRAKLSGQNLVFRWLVYISVIMAILLATAGTTAGIGEFMYAHF